MSIYHLPISLHSDIDWFTSRCVSLKYSLKPNVYLTFGTNCFACWDEPKTFLVKNDFVVLRNNKMDVEFEWEWFVTMCKKVINIIKINQKLIISSVYRQVKLDIP